jgi:hypothetical protein
MRPAWADRRASTPRSGSSQRQGGRHEVAPRYLVQLSSVEIAFLHTLVQRQMGRLPAEHSKDRRLDPVAVSAGLVLLITGCSRR